MDESYVRWKACAALTIASLWFHPVTAQPPSCDPSYECRFTALDYFNNPFEFDFSGLCNPLDYQGTDSSGLVGYNFNICGVTANHKCLPEGSNQYAQVYAAAVQFTNVSAPPPGTSCFNPVTNATEPCTATCEILGSGEPIWTLTDPLNPYNGGVQLSYFGVESTVYDKNACPKQPNGAPGIRKVTIRIDCDATVAPLPFKLYNITEVSVCNYVIWGASAQACGCDPYCVGSTCGDDGCGGSCSGGAYSTDTGCPFGYDCMSTQYFGMAANQCCSPDCTNRDCGDDGCGGQCGTCGDDEVCTEYSVCVPTADIPTNNPAFLPLSSEIVYYTDGGSLFTLYLTGVLLVALPMWFSSPGGKHMVYRVRMQGLRGLIPGKGDDSVGLMGTVDGREDSKGGATTSLKSASKFGGGYGATNGSSAGYGSAQAVIAASTTEL